ncbi:hypothetical protein MTR67_007611 [Solanum verrucosum]|uniref:VWFA domain-containing protein n=1 Tax=Solanum verrucosum TaxID=315347 RepID=A0AAF0TCW6_SOLVR|nr:hypothetical protein MTR67_007611 [Solanum verrucosum]
MANVAQNVQKLAPLLRVRAPPLMVWNLERAHIDLVKFGSNHDSSALYVISDASSDTFSFIELFVTVQDAFAVCIGGILSIVSKEFQLSCIATSPAIQNVSISSDRYVNEISEHQEQAVITIGDIVIAIHQKWKEYLHSAYGIEKEALSICISADEAKVNSMFNVIANASKVEKLVRAPPVMDWNLERAPIDLDTVLDISGNMNGTKLTLLKKAMCLVIENLGPFDQLSIVTFSSIAHRRQNAVGMSTFPGHTFEFGSDHNSSALYAIADASRGTFSFIGLFVTAQEIHVSRATKIQVLKAW